MYKWKNIDLSTKGIIVEKKPTISKGKKKIETFDIPGRNGFLSIDTGVYQPFEVSLECHIDANSFDLDEVKELLDGYGILQLDNDRQYTAIVNNAIPFEVVARKFRSFIIQFLCNPIAESTTETTYAVGNSPQTLTINDTYTTIYPTIEIKATTTMNVTINDTNFKLDIPDTTKTYILDCKNQVVATTDGINVAHFMSGDFPTLKKGNNTITYTGTKTIFNIKYRKTYL